jgi:hypothetical protein
MADVSIDSSIGTATARGLRSLVFIDADTGYQFYGDSAGAFGYSKTTDGGASWGAFVQVVAASALAFDVWYDRWTPGDTTGTLIHVVYFNTTNDNANYRTLDTSTDTLGTQRIAFDGATAVADNGAFISVTKAVGGNLYLAFDLDAGAETGFYRSTDGGVNWVARTNVVEAADDWACLYPANAADTQDIWAVYLDASTNELTIKTHDDSADTWSESTAVACIESVTDLGGQYPFSASVRHSDGHLIIAYVNDRDTATADHRLLDWDGSTATAKTDIVTNIDDHYYPALFIDQNTDDLYVAYNGARAGSETLGTSTKVYYTKSTDDGATWSAGDTAYMEGAAAAVLQTWAPIMGPRFYVSWRVGQTLNGNKVNSVTFSANVSGSVSVTEAADTSSASATVTNNATLAVTEAADTAEITGSVPVDISGSLTVTEAADTLAANGRIRVAGSVAITEANDVSAIAGLVRVTGTVSITEANDVLEAAGSVPVPVSGSVTIIEESDALAASGVVEVPEPPASAADGPWRKLTGDYPRVRRREPPPVIPFPPALPAPAPAPIAVVAWRDSPYREQLLGELVAPVPRETTGREDEELAIALLLAA